MSDYDNRCLLASSIRCNLYLNIFTSADVVHVARWTDEKQITLLSTLAIVDAFTNGPLPNQMQAFEGTFYCCVGAQCLVRPRDGTDDVAATLEHRKLRKLVLSNFTY